MNALRPISAIPSLESSALFTALLLVASGCADDFPLAASSARSGAGVLYSHGSGPRIELWSNSLGTWKSGMPSESREAFITTGLRFEWMATPGLSGAAVAWTSYAVGDTTEWSPPEPSRSGWPVSDEDPVLWFPEVGSHTFFVRAADDAGEITVLAAPFAIFAGPRFCPVEDRTILVVLDTDPRALQQAGIWPADYEARERALVQEWFDGYSIQVLETGGVNPPSVGQMNCASSVFWFHSADVRTGDHSVLQAYHTSRSNPLAGYVASGGNLLLCGLRPSEAIRYFRDDLDETAVRRPYPVDFTDASGPSPHWAWLLGLTRVENTVGGSNPDPTLPDGVGRARGQSENGGVYPDLPFDPSTWPGRRGFGYFDRQVTGTWAPTIYRRDDTEVSLAISQLFAPGVNGNSVYLGFHPYFIERAAFGELIERVMHDFGEVAVAPTGRH